jgi:hypothetical protein
MSTEETVIPPAPEGGTPPPEPASTEPAAPTGWDAIDKWFTTSTEDGTDVDAALEAHVNAVTPEFLAGLDPAARLTAQSVKARADKLVAEAMAKVEATEKAANERVAKIEAEKERRFRELDARERAHLEAMAAFKPPGAEPEVDVFTADGMKARMKFEADRAAWESAQPARETLRAKQVQALVSSVQDRYPDLKDEKVSAEFDAFMDRENEGWDPASKTRPPLEYERGARLFMSERTARIEKEQREQRVRAEDQARVVAASRIGGRASGAGAADPYTTFKRMKEADADQAWGYFATLSEAEKASVMSHYN